jgi:flagellin-like hook-associated protein FlgL
VDINFATNTTMTLLNRLGRATGDSSFEVDSSSTANLSDSYSSTGASKDNYHTLIIRDSLQTGGYMYGAVSLYSQQLDQLSGYLVQLRDKEIAIISEVDGSAAHTQLLAEKQTIEENMSAFIGKNVHGTDLNLISVQGSGIAPNESFMDVINVRENASDPNSDIVGMVSSVEVDLMEIFAHSHNESTCPHCLQASISTSGERPVEIATSSTSGATPDKGATSSSTSLDAQVETIRSGSKWNISGSDTLSYSFYEGTVPYPNTYNDGNTSSGANGLEQGITATGPDNVTALTNVMAAWDKTVDFDFAKVIEDGPTGEVGDIRMAFTTDGSSGGRAAFAYYPSSSHVGGDVWFETHDIESDYDASGNDFNSTGLGDGGYSWYAALHEVGHALGLSHPFDGGSSSGATLPAAEDNMRTSVMSYTQQDRNLVFQYTSSGSSFNTGSSYRVYATTPMLADVKAMHSMYGAETTSDGDTSYSFTNDGTRNQPLMMQTIIDSGGTDTIDLSNQTKSSTLNLNGGTLSSIGMWSEADQVTYWAGQTGLTTTQVQNSFDFYNTQATTNYPGKVTSAIYTGEDNLGIAHDAAIENAIGGSAADTITGNSLDNMITGGGGDDIIDGGDGDDVAVYSGDRNAYTINTSGGTTTVNSGGSEGTDTLTNIEFLQFSAGAATARGASARTSLDAVADLTGASTFDIAVDGGATVSVTFNGLDYTSGGKTMTDLMTDLQTAINTALTGAGESGSVTVTQNSPLTITSNETGAASAILLSNLSGPLQAALGGINNEGRIQVGDTIYYNIGGGYLTATPSGSFTPSNPTPPAPTPPAPTSPTPPTPSTPSTPGSPTITEVVEGNAAGLPSHIGSISLETQEDAANAVIVLDRAIQQITQSQAKLGAIQNRLDYNISNLSKSAMLTETAKGRITDADFAAETAILVKNQILQQAAMQALNMANQSRQGVLGLIG